MSLEKSRALRSRNTTRLIDSQIGMKSTIVFRRVMFASRMNEQVRMQIRKTQSKSTAHLRNYTSLTFDWSFCCKDCFNVIAHYSNVPGRNKRVDEPERMSALQKAM